MSAVSSLASALGIDSLSEPVSLGIAAFDLVSNTEVDDSLRGLQYFPESITDTKSPDYSRRRIPGGSHPIMSFIHGGERVISFQTVFTQIRNPEDNGTLASILTGSFDISLKPDTKHSMQDGIAPAIAWLRSFTCATYNDDGSILPPPAAVVYLPNSGIIGAGQYEDSFVGVMVECGINYEAFHRNGEPRIVGVTLSFVEMVQTADDWRFYGAENFADLMAKYVVNAAGPDKKNIFGGFG